jgi:hypothetical protein
MQRFLIKTLIDITRVDRQKQLDQIKKSQQDNFQTLMQTLEMRGNIYYDKDPFCAIEDWSQHGHGKKEKTWIWEIYTEQNDLFKIGNDPIGSMKDDIEFVPFTAGCEETAKFKQAIFTSKKKPVNILFEYIDK